MGTIIVAGILFLVIAGIAASLIRDKEQGKSCCSGSYANCRGCHH